MEPRCRFSSPDVKVMTLSEIDKWLARVERDLHELEVMQKMEEDKAGG